MVLYFLRHAEASPDAGSDFDRILTPKGLEQAERVGKFLLRAGILPPLILASPVTRAWQTAKIVAQKLGEGELVQADWIACGMSPETCLEELGAYKRKEAVMLVGHEPDFSVTIASLLGLPDAGALNIRKASLTAVELNAFAFGAGQLQFMVPVRLM